MCAARQTVGVRSRTNGATRVNDIGRYVRVNPLATANQRADVRFRVQARSHMR
jgi:hypothetical protein